MGQYGKVSKIADPEVGPEGWGAFFLTPYIFSIASREAKFLYKLYGGPYYKGEQYFLYMFITFLYMFVYPKIMWYREAV